MTRRHSIRPLQWAAVTCLLVALQSGCTTALTAAYLRDGLWDGSEHAAESDDRATTATAPEAEPPQPSATDRERREAALEEAMARLARLGQLDPAVEAAIVASLQRTEPEDWPVVVEEFATSLASAAPPAALARDVVAPSAAPEPAPAEAAPEPAAESPASQAESLPAADAPGSGPVADADPPPAREDAAAPDALTPTASPEPASLAVRDACFASAVRGWGDVVRFAADRFRPGQDVIVYVELDNVSAGTSPAGRTTCIDAVLRLVDEQGSPLHAWNFDPLAETRAVPRRDYFTRYVVRIPEATRCGPCRIEIEVTDALAGSTATATLPLEIASE